MSRNIKIYLFSLSMSLCCGSKPENMTSAVTRMIRSVEFPQGSGMGIFFAIGIPLDIPDKSVSMAFYFEANYLLPDRKNATYYDEYEGRNFNRKMAYKIIQNKLESAGYPGKQCLLRAICEASNTPVTQNGLIGDVLHIFFTPSSTMNEDLSSEIIEAEFKNNCNQYCNCPISILNLISYFDDK